MVSKTTLLALALAMPMPALAGEFSMSAPNLDDYCFYSIYTTLGAYTFYGSVDSSSSSSSSNSSSSGSTSHGSSGSSSGSTSHGSSSSSSSSSGVKTTPHGRKLRRGHHSSTSGNGFCQAKVEVMSLYASALKLCSKEQRKGLQDYWEYLCEQSSYTLMSLTGIEANATESYIASLPILNPEVNTTTNTGTIMSPVVLDKSYYERAYKSYVTHDYALTKDKRYSYGLMGYWAGIVVVGMLIRGWNAIANKRRQSRRLDAESGSVRPRSFAPGNAIVHFLRTYFIIPASFGNHHQQLLWYHTIPKRIDMIIVFGFWAISIILCAANYESFAGNIQTTNLAEQNWQYLADRSGILSYACLPFIWLFSGRNNIFLWATPFSVQSFNIFHRHAAWVCTILAIVHSIAYTVVFILYDGRYWNAWKQEYWYMGVVATIVMAFMLVQSMTILRRKWYEVFLIIHIVFGILTIYSLFMHTSFDGTKWNGYLWPMVALWSFDRAVRLFRIAYCNINIRLSKEMIATTKPIVRYSEGADLVKIEVTPSAKSLKPKAGEHYYLYQPFTLKGWENHPFTLGAYVPSADGSKLIFYIRPYDGWTRRLRDQCRKNNGEIRPTLLLEGPYGHQAPLHTFDTVLMIVGGTGIASAVPYLLDHITRASESATKTMQIHLVWTARQTEMFSQVFCDELAAITQHSDITITFFCTAASAIQTPSSHSDSESSPVDTEKKAAGDLVKSVSDPDIQITTGRLNVRATVSAAVDEAKANSANLAVLTCGPAKMADECRASVYEAMKNGYRDVQYYEEAFGW